MPTAVSVVGAVAFAAAAVGSTIVVGRLTDELIQPAFRGHVERRSILLGVAAVIAVGIARGVSVVVRRYFAAMLEARMQVTLRTGVVDKYLSVPMAFHQSRPTGELLAHDKGQVFTLHLRVLRESGFVESRIEAQRRLYRLRPEPLMEIDAWLHPFRRFWSKHVDALEQHLDKMDKAPAKKGKKRHGKL